MSAQTGEDVPDGPASTRAADRVRFRFAKLYTDPNPIWIRELRQSARLTRTPLILMTITIVVALAIAAVGGSASESEPNDVVGAILFHAFFSVGFFVVALVGPALAANAIASEREGRTWEAIVLTGLSPKLVARGKFLAAFSDVAAYIVMLAPVGALPFLFGGVHWLEVVIAFAYLFVFAALGVAFGLALSSKMQSSRGAILLTLLTAVPVSGAVYGMLGPGLSFLVHELWGRVARGFPVWIPAAYVRGDFGQEYVLILIVGPILLVGLPAWLLYETTVANLMEPTDDRSTGLKRWLVAAVVALSIASVATLYAPTSAKDVLGFAFLTTIMLAGFLGTAALIFLGEPFAPSRRVRLQQSRARAGRVARFFGPGLVRTAWLLVALGALGFVAITTAALIRYDEIVALAPRARRDDELLLRFVAYAVGFFLFVVGFGVWLRSRSNSVMGSRIVLVAAVAGIAIVPWIVTAVVGVASRDDSVIMLASPSPLFAFYLLGDRSGSLSAVGETAALCWGVLGALLLLSGSRRVRATQRAIDDHFSRADAAFAAEDAAAAAVARDSGESEP